MPASVSIARTEPDAPRDDRLPVVTAVLVGVLAAALAFGFGLLAAWLAIATGAAPSNGRTHSTSFLLLGAAAVIVVGTAVGLLSRRRTGRGVVVLLVLGALATVAAWFSAWHGLSLAVPVIATVAGVAGLVLLARAGRVTRPESRAATSRQVTTRRRALLIGALLAVAAGTAGVLGPMPVAVRPRALGPTGPRGGGSAQLRGTVIDVRSLGAVGDGVADDSAAIQRGVEAAGAARGTLYLPAGRYRCASALTLRPGAGVTLAGDPGASVLEFAAAGPSGFALCASIDADDVTIDGLVLRRAGDFDAVLLSTGVMRNFTLSRTTFDGGMDAFPNTYCHGIKLSDSAVASGMHLVDSTITGTQYGLFQTNQSTANTTGVLVERCLFSGNRNTDLEFNSPNGATRQVQVRDCRFENNLSTGFGVGFAAVEGALVTGNTFENYAMEAVHIEDYSSSIVVERNDFTACGLAKHSYVQIVSGARGVTVRDNSFDARANEAEIFVVTSQPGGSGVTGGGRPIVPPFDVALSDNTMDCAASVTPVYFEGTTGGVIAGNTITAEAIEGQEQAFRLLQAPDTTVQGNTVNGQAY
ncbi:MAG: glycosyl hydrolase family 28-related protein [Pseudonocardia sediminis]